MNDASICISHPNPPFKQKVKTKKARNVTPYKQADPVCMGYRNIANPVLASVVPNAQDQRAVIDYK